MNNAGLIVGGAAVPDELPRAVMWPTGAGSIQTLGSFVNSPGHANGVNDSGQIVGEFASGPAGEYRGFVWANGIGTTLSTLGGEFENAAYGINDYGVIVGKSETTAGVMRAVRWVAGQIEDLGTLGGTLSWAVGINNAGSIVGAAQTPTGLWHAFIWQNNVMRDLNALVSNKGGWDLLRVDALNESGWIVGTGLLNGQSRPFLLIPVVNRPPVAVDDIGATDEDTALSVAVPGVLANDTDPDTSDVLKVSGFDATSAQGASVAVNPDGSFSYDPRSSTTLNALAVGATKIDTFQYRVTDGQVESPPVTVSITVTGVNDPPLVNIIIIKDDAGREIGPDDMVFVGQTITLTGSFTDPDLPEFHSADVIWGDGKVTALDPVYPGDTITADHIYAVVPASGPAFTVKLVITDSAPESGSAERTIKVVNATAGLTDLAQDLTDLLGQLSSDAAKAVQKAIDSIIGQNGGAASNGATDMLDQGNANAALVKIREAIQSLQTAINSDPLPELTDAQRLLALAAASIVTEIADAAAKIASTPADKQRVVQARALIQNGKDLIGAGNFLGALDRFQNALSVLQPASPKKAGLWIADYKLFIEKNSNEARDSSIQLWIWGRPGTDIEIEHSFDLQNWASASKVRIPYTGLVEITPPVRSDRRSGFFRRKPDRVESE